MDIQPIQGTVRHLDELLHEAIDIERLGDPAIARDLVEADVTTHLGKFRLGDVDVAPADARAKVQAHLERAHDETLLVRVLQCDADMQATEAALEAKIASSRRAAVPRATIEDAMSELLMYRRFEGRTLADLLRAYQASADDDPTGRPLVHFVELGDWASTFRLRPSDDDVATIPKLQAAIHARQDARQDAHATEHLRILRERRDRSAGLSLLGHLLRSARAARHDPDRFLVARRARPERVRPVVAPRGPQPIA